MLYKVIYILFGAFISVLCFQKNEVKTECPKVKAIQNFDLQQMLGKWYVVQYYATSEEAIPYRCMKADFTVSQFEVSMNFSYSFTDDPLNEELFGNITWKIPNPSQPAHWTHSEDTYEGVYNTYVVDSDYKSWTLLLHCAEKSKSPRYLSSFIMSREPLLSKNVISYLKDKLPRYGIDLAYMFGMKQTDCDIPQTGIDIPPSVLANRLMQNITHNPFKSHIH